MALSTKIKWISGICALLLPIGGVSVAIWAFADDVLYTQAEADIHLSQDSRRICIEDGAKLVILEAQYPPGSVIPPHVAVMIAELRESVAQHCVKRG
jgi:hypothetical protein